jgi:hypothetical protein
MRCKIWGGCGHWGSYGIGRGNRVISRQVFESCRWEDTLGTNETCSFISLPGSSSPWLKIESIKSKPQQVLEVRYKM